MQNKTIIYNVLTVAVTAALSLTSCMKDELFNTPHPDKGAVVVATDWTDAIAESDTPASYMVSVDGGAAKPASGKTFTYPDLLTPGGHSLLAYNEAQGLTLDGKTATVNMLEDGTADPMPGYLFSAQRSLTVVQDDTLRVEVPMNRRVCPIAVAFSLKGEYVGEIADITATLGGLAGSVDLATGVVGTENLTAKLVPMPVFMQSASGAEDKVLKYGCRVLGITVGASQTLTVTITMRDGYVSTITSDLTEYLKDLNADMKPIELTGTVEAPQDGHFGGTIEEWDVVNGGDIDAQ